MVTVAKKGSCNHKKTLEVILGHVAKAVSGHQLVLSDMSFVRVCVPMFGLLEATSPQGLFSVVRLFCIFCVNSPQIGVHIFVY